MADFFILLPLLKFLVVTSKIVPAFRYFRHQLSMPNMPSGYKPFNSILVKPSGPDCNLGCSYCFYLDKAQLFPESQTHRMTDDVLEERVRQVMQQSGDAVSDPTTSWLLPAPPRGALARVGIIVAGAAIALLFAIGIVTAGMVVPAKVLLTWSSRIIVS